MRYVRAPLTLPSLIAVAGLLLACGGVGPIKPDPQPEPPVVPSPQAEAPPKSAKQKTIERLLAEADAALKKDRMTQPAHDNAYDRFRAVQMLDPGNKQAQAGLDSILLAYADRIQRGLSAGLISAAAAELKVAKAAFPNAELLATYEAEIKKRTPAPQKSDSGVKKEEGRGKVVLPAQALAQKSEEAKQLLIEIAQRVQQSDEAVMIYARSDAEGRWIYKTMKDSVGGYRIRGDIRISREPAIEFLSPLE